MSGRPFRRGELVQSPDRTGWTVYLAEDDSLHVLNESARAIWELCDGETTPEEMGQAVSDLAGTDMSEALGTVTIALESLAARGLIENLEQPAK